MIELGLVQQKRPVVPFLLTVLARFAAGLMRRFVLLRNKPNLLFASFCSQL